MPRSVAFIKTRHFGQCGSSPRINLRNGDAMLLEPGSGAGTGKPHDPEKEALSAIIARLNELFAGDSLTDQDRLNYLHTIKHKVLENEAVV